MNAYSWCTRLAIACVSLSLAACAEVTIRSGDKAAEATVLGVQLTQTNDLTQPISISTRGVGLIAGIRHVAVGWLDEDVVIFPDASQCRLLVLVRDPRDIEVVVAVLKASGIPPERICAEGR